MYIINNMRKKCISDSVRYHAVIKLVNISAIVSENVDEYLEQKISKYVSTDYDLPYFGYSPHLLCRCENAVNE